MYISLFLYCNNDLLYKGCCTLGTTFTPLSLINSAFISDKGNCYHALEKCEGVIRGVSKHH